MNLVALVSVHGHQLFGTFPPDLVSGVYLFCGYILVSSLWSSEYSWWILGSGLFAGQSLSEKMVSFLSGIIKIPAVSIAATAGFVIIGLPAALSQRTPGVFPQLMLILAVVLLLVADLLFREWNPFHIGVTVAIIGTFYFSGFFIEPVFQPPNVANSASSFDDAAYFSAAIAISVQTGACFVPTITPRSSTLIHRDGSSDERIIQLPSTVVPLDGILPTYFLRNVVRKLQLSSTASHTSGPSKQARQRSSFSSGTGSDLANPQNRRHEDHRGHKRYDLGDQRLSSPPSLYTDDLDCDSSSKSNNYSTETESQGGQPSVPDQNSMPDSDELENMTDDASNDTSSPDSVIPPELSSESSNDDSSSQPHSDIFSDNNSSSSNKQNDTPSIENTEFHWEAPPDISFNDIGGYQQVKEELEKDVIAPAVSNSPQFERFNVEPDKGVLLHGPPGTGKTLFARAMANALNRPFVELNHSNLTSHYVNIGAKLVSRLFYEAQECGGVVFIDEAETLFSKRDQGMGNNEDSKVTNAFLSELAQEQKDFIVILATNRKDMIDDAVLRAGRLDKHIEIGKPDAKERAAILEKKLEDVPIADKEQLLKFAESLEGATGAEIEHLSDRTCREAGYANDRYITLDHLQEAAKQIRND